MSCSIVESVTIYEADTGTVNRDKSMNLLRTETGFRMKFLRKAVQDKLLNEVMREEV
jgi:hypothetical protein